ncbi:isopeptide-forming domain-containing fimbrial protein [Malonomonas rubra]|uniref:isopeptide-forming domain-containing fimbrial protein n=1 Tax=Malonomonas rubra TaxID=57040 RepID=UPI0026ED1CB6|nr:isopeptide-forming domain-containing fimbrial protein [Malonomonas rubra]
MQLQTHNLHIEEKRNRIRGGWFGLLLLVLLLAVAGPVQAVDKFCSDAPYFGVIDGNVHPVPNQITIDRDCTFQNFPESNPLTTTVNFQTNDPSIYLIIFNNVIFTGHMACASIDHRIWFSNGSDYGSSNSCQDLFIPVESIAKQAPAETAAVGVPFTYTLTLPSMTEVGGPSLNDLHTVTLWDDLTATGAALTYVDINAYYKNSGTPVTLVPENDPDALGGIWTSKNLSYKPLPLILKGEQIIVELTVVLDDSPVNTVGTSFTNTAKWSFGRLIEGEFYSPLPGEWGVSEPMTIAAPELVVTKTSDETALNLGVPVTFTIEVQNVGGSEAWNTSVVDQIPDGMCDQDPTATLSARIIAADGSPVATLEQGIDFTLNYDATPAPTCPLSLDLKSAKAVIGPSERLLISYESQLDGDTTADGLTLTNVAGAVKWFSADPNGGTSPKPISRTLSDGTPGVDDHQDSQSVTTALSGYYFQKTVTNLTSNVSPATTAAPGDQLRYRLRVFNVDQTLNDITLLDQLNPTYFDLGSFSMVTLPAGSAFSFDPVTGMLQINGGSGDLNVAVGEELVIEFDVTLRSSLSNGTLVVNQAEFTAFGPLNAISDDPYFNGIAPPGEPADPTRVEIQSPGPLEKSNDQSTATIGEQFIYSITVPAEPVAIPLYDVRVMDNLSLSTADLRFISAEIAGGSWVPNNVGSDTNLIIADTSTGIDIPANGQAIIKIRVELLNSVTNQTGLSFANSASYSYNRSNGNETTRTLGGAGSSPNMRIVEPALSGSKAVSFILPAGKPSTDPAVVGDILEYRISMTNNGDSTAFDVSVVDTPPAEVLLVPGSATAQLNGVGISGFVAEPTELVGGGLVWGPLNDDGSLDIPAGQTLVLTYQVTVSSVAGTAFSNSVYLDWSSLDGDISAERTGDGCPTVTAPDDYCYGPATVSVSTLDNTTIIKTVADDSFAETPASSGAPIVRVGDTVTYDLTLNLQEYITQDVAVEDQLPVGMRLESFSIIGGSGFGYTLTSQPAAGATGTLRWEFGDINNPPSADGTPLDPLVIRYVTRVITDAPPLGIAYDIDTARDNQVQLSYAGGDPVLFPNRLTASAEISVRQPQMSAISKSDLGTGRDGSGTAVDPYRVNIATDVMNFRLSSCNEGLAPAYGVVLTDQLAPEFDESGLISSPPVVRIGSTTLSVGTDYNLTAPNRGGELRIALQDSAPVNPGECVIVDYNLGFHTDLTVSKTWNNRARLAEYRSLPLAEAGRLYAAGSSADVWMTNLVNVEQLLKSLESAPEATIGDEVTYRIRVPVLPMNRALDDLVITDSLPAALEYLSASAIDNSGASVSLVDNSSAPGDISLGIGQIPAGEQVTITLRTRVVNNAAANAGNSIINTASYTYAGMPVGLDTASSSGPLTIVEPTLTIAKSAVNLSNPSSAPVIGDILRYDLVFMAAGGVVGDAYSSAFDLAIEDSLGVGLAYRGGTVVIDGAGNTIADPTVSVDAVSTAQTLNWSLADATADIDVLEGTQVTLSYEVEVLGSVLPGQTLTNSAVARWTGQDGDNPFERSGSGLPEENDYVTTPAEISLTAALSVVLGKSVVNLTTREDPGVNATPGDRLRYTLVLSNQSLTPLTNGVLIDELSAQFAAGSLQLISVPPDADITATNPSGGSAGTGMVHLGNLSLAAQGEAGDSLTLVFEATLAPVIQSGTQVLNRAQLSGDNLATVISNQTSTLITSAPALEVWKTSQDLTDDLAVLMAGDTLRYTITVKNVGTENAVNVLLRDQIPANTRYLNGTTTLNDNPVADPAPGVSPLRDGLFLNSPEDATAGAMRADATSNSANVATVSFDVVINADVIDGAVIVNQGFVDFAGTGSGSAPEEPSDDPATAVADDPTRDVVGNLPLIDAHKTVDILVDNGSLGIVDPGDRLRYTIVVTNTAATPATAVVLRDAVPAFTTYVDDSVQLNGLPVGQPDLGVSPLTAGIDLSSSDLTPPLPSADGGILSANGTATISFDVEVQAGVAEGTIISNQGFVSSAEQADEPTDADGIDSNGDQPTQIVVGAAQQLSILKQVAVIDGGTAEAGSQLEYLIRVTNIGSLPATQVLVTDDLALKIDGLPPLADYVDYIANSARLNGSATGVTFMGTQLTADYAAEYGDLPAGADFEVRFRVRIKPTVARGTTLTNSAQVTWDNNPPVSAEVSLDVGGAPESAALNGRVWHDADLNLLDDDGERPLEGWTVELSRAGRMLASVLTNVDGEYRFSGLPTNETTGEFYQVRFLARGAGPDTASLGDGDSPFTNGPQQISDITVPDGANLQNLNLPITPNGVIYDSIRREPIAGAQVTLINAVSGNTLPSTCFDDPRQQEQLTALDGYYKFALNFGDAACPAGTDYLIEVVPPPSGYTGMPSRIIPPTSDATTTAFSVPACLGSAADAVPTSADSCQVVVDAEVPLREVAPRTAGTAYHLHLKLDNSLVPGDSQIFNNPIPIDPVADEAVAITKTAARLTASRGDLVPYTIRVNNVFGVPLTDVSLIDRFPAGFKYVTGSARLDAVPAEPHWTGRELSWENLDLPVDASLTLQLLLVVGGGVSEGEYVNRALVRNSVSGDQYSGEATATVRIVPDPTFDCSDVIGKVFDDRNRNGQQESGEDGLAGVRLATARGLLVTTDPNGRFHITCAQVPDLERGSNFILKLDDRTLPSGFRLTTENPRVQRATRGKTLRFNFGATLHRVVTIDVADGAFEPDSTELRPQWQPRIDQLLQVLKEATSVLRLSYLADIEAESLVKKRLAMLKRTLTERWEQGEGNYRLAIESEVFWRRGSPP